MKRCENNDCKAENPEEANFCRKCGKEILKKESPWVDTSTIEMTFEKPQKKTFNLLLILLLIFIGLLVWAIIINLMELGLPSLFSILFIILILIYKSTFKWRKKKEIIKIASVIENNNKNTKILRKADRYGLYDWIYKKVLLKVEFDFIERMDDFYYLTKVDGKFGIFNKPLNKIIAECKYDKISPFQDGIAIIEGDGKIMKIDTQGNIFEHSN